MTSDVKRREQLFLRLPPLVPCLSRKSRRQEDTTVDQAASRGLVPTFRVSVGCLPHARAERPLRPPHAAAGSTPPGRRLCRETEARWRALAATSSRLSA